MAAIFVMLPIYIIYIDIKHPLVTHGYPCQHLSPFKIKIEASKIRVLNCVQTKQFNCKLINLIVNECSLTLENNGLSQSEQWWHDINVIKSCRVMLRTFPSTLHPPRHILMSLTAKYFQSQCLKTLSELCVAGMVCWQWQWWTDVTALLCLAVTLRHQPCHTQSHGKCHHTSLGVTHRFRSFAEFFENIQLCFCCLCFHISDDIYKCKQLNDTVHSKIHCRCIRYSWASFWSMTMICIFSNKTSTMWQKLDTSTVSKSQ